MSVTGPVGNRHPPWFRIAGGMLIICWLIVTPALSGGWIRSRSPVAALVVTCVLAFLSLLAFVFLVTEEARAGGGRPFLRRWAPWIAVAISLVLSWRSAIVFSESEAVIRAADAPESAWPIFASGAAGAILGLLLARLRAYPSHAPAGESPAR